MRLGYKNNITGLPESIGNLTNLRSLDLGSDDSQISRLPESIGGLVNLTSLCLSNAPLTELPESILKLPTLKELRLSSDVYLSTVSKLPALETLYISSIDSLAATIPPEFSNLATLKNLSMDKCSFQEDEKIQANPLVFPKTITQLKNLQRLEMSQNTFCSLGDTFSDLINLEYLDLTYALAHLEELPDFSKLTNLKTLVFCGYDTPLLPKQELVIQFFSHYLPNLINLKLDKWRGYPSKRSNLGSLPDLFDNMPNLERLDLSYNGLETLPPSLYRLKNLKELDLSFNKLTEIDEGIGNLVNLETLIIAVNKDLTKLPESFNKLTKLKCLCITATKIDPSTVCKLPGLKIKTPPRIDDLALSNHNCWRFGNPMEI